MPTLTARIFLPVFAIAVLVIPLALGLLVFDDLPDRAPCAVTTGSPVPTTQPAATRPAAANSGPAARP